jgi:hypothetical protein
MSTWTSAPASTWPSSACPAPASPRCWACCWAGTAWPTARLLVDGHASLAHRTARGSQALRQAAPPGSTRRCSCGTGQLLDNLVYASDQDDLAWTASAAVSERARLRGVLEQKLPQGLQTLARRRRRLLSGGEGQRVRLGRALLQTASAPGAAGRALPRPGPPQRRAPAGRGAPVVAGGSHAAVRHPRRRRDASRLRPRAGGRGRPHRRGRCDRPTSGRGQDSRYAALLAAERSLQQGLFGDTEAGAWRHLHLADGRLHDMSATGRRKAMAAGGLPAGTGHCSHPGRG